MAQKILEEFYGGHRHVFYRDDETLGKRECTIEVDDPGLDCTDFAHPAFLRGQDLAVDYLAKRFIAILDGKDSGAGGFSHKGLQTLRVRLLELIDDQS